MNANNHVAITGDFNRDGKLDLFAGLRGVPPGVQSAFFVNTSELGDQGWLELLLRGTTYGSSPTNFRTTRDAVGARVEIYADLDGDGAIDFNELIGDNFTSPLLDPFDETMDVGAGGGPNVRSAKLSPGTATTG